MSIVLSPQDEIKLINKFFKDYHIAANVVAERSVPIKGSFMSYAISLQAGGTIVSIENKLRELSERMSFARLSETPVRLRGMPLSVEVPSANPQPLTPPPDLMSSLAPYHMMLGQKVGYGGVEDLNMDLRTMEHMLVAGTTGSGKSSLINTMLSSLMWSTSPKDLSLVLVDPKNDDFVPYKQMPHTVASAYHKEDVLPVVEAVWKEKNRRIQMTDSSYLPQLLVAVDEWAELYEDKDFLFYMASIMQTGRSVGVHVIACTQLPLSNVIGSMGKAQLTYRFVGRVMSAVDSNTASGVKGLNAQFLPGKGSFLAVANGGVTRFQAYFLGKIGEDTHHAVRAKWNLQTATPLLIDMQAEQMELWSNATVVGE